GLAASEPQRRRATLLQVLRRCFQQHALDPLGLVVWVHEDRENAPTQVSVQAKSDQTEEFLPCSCYQVMLGLRVDVRVEPFPVQGPGLTEGYLPQLEGSCSVRGRLIGAYVNAHTL